MSMISSTPQLTIVPVRRVYLDPDAYLFGNTVQDRRQELGLSLFEAADLSGLTIWQWAAIEEGLLVPHRAQPAAGHGGNSRIELLHDGAGRQPELCGPESLRGSSLTPI